MTDPSPPSLLPRADARDHQLDLASVRLAVGIPIRNVARFLPRLIDELLAAGTACADIRIVMAENDSVDDTAAIALAAAEANSAINLLRFPGLAGLVPSRTDRLAFLRNSIVEDLLAATHGGDGWTAVFADADEVTSSMTSDDVLALVHFIHEHPEYSAATANSEPVYYDIWTLRCEGWSPDDCWSQVNARPAAMSYDDAVRSFVAGRQVPLAPARPPIAVSSAFGGLAAYHLGDVRSCRYGGHTASGEACSDHVPMNLELVGQTGRQLAIVPGVVLKAPQEHLALVNLEAAKASSGAPAGSSSGAARELRRVGRRIKREWHKHPVRPSRRAAPSALHPTHVDEFILAMSPDHALPRYAQQFRAYERPIRSIALGLRRSYGRRIRAIDVGANVGDTTVALVVAAGAEVLAMEGDREYLAALAANVAPLGSRVTVVDEFATATGSTFGEYRRLAGTARFVGQHVQRAGEPSVVATRALSDVVSHHGWDDADLFKTDTDGNDFELITAALDIPWRAPPVLFFEFDPSLDPGGVDAGLELIERVVAHGYRRLYVWDNFGNLLGLIDSSHLTWFGGLCAYLDRCKESGGGLCHVDVAAFCDDHPPFDGDVQLRPVQPLR